MSYLAYAVQYRYTLERRTMRRRRALSRAFEPPWPGTHQPSSTSTLARDMDSRFQVTRAGIRRPLRPASKI